MTGRTKRRRPLQWYSVSDGVGVDGQVPDCDDCWELLSTPLFREAVYSVAIEHPGDPAALARRAIEAYHHEGHPRDAWGVTE